MDATTLGSLLRPARAIAAVATLAAFAAVACRDHPTAPPKPASVAASGATVLTGIVGAAVPVSPTVVVLGDDGQPFAGATVMFAATQGGGQMLGGTVVTNILGLASAGGWVLGTAPGVYTATATIGTLPPVTFTATATAAAAARLVLAAGDGQQGDIGVALADPLSVRATDAFGNPVRSVTVTFALTAGTGSIATTAAVTNTAGIASTSLTLAAPGVSAVAATSVDVPGVSVVFNASTGPTIVGQVVPPSGVGPLRPFVPASTSARSAPLLFKPNAVPLVAQPTGLSAEEAARIVPLRRWLVVSYRPAAFALPTSAQAYVVNDVQREAVAAYTAAVTPFETAGMLLHREISPAIGAVRVEVMPGQNADSVIALLRSDPRVLAVEDDAIQWTDDVGRMPAAMPASLMAAGSLTPSTEVYPSDPGFYQQLWHYAMVDAPRAWKVTTGSSTVLVGVIDTGVRPDHPALAGLLTSDQYDFVSSAASFASPQSICSGGTFLSFRGTAADEAMPRTTALQTKDLFLASTSATCWSSSTLGSHGSHVTGTIGSTGNDGVGGTGLNWSVRLRPVRALGVTGSGFSFDVAQAILYQAGLPAAVPGSTTGETVQTTPAQIVNMSLGGTTLNTVQQNAITAASANTLFIASAGNSASQALNYPSAFPEVFSVVALSPDYSLASYSSLGSTVDIAAPGGDFRLSGTGGVVSSTWNFVTNTPNYAFVQGTSMAAPHVAGVAALTLAVNPGLTPAQLRARLEQSAVDLGPPGRDDRFGAGLVSAYRSITGVSGPIASTTVRAIDATTGAVARSMRLGADGRFTFTKLGNGSYFLVASQDEGNDGVFGLAGRRAGWFGTGQMQPVVVAGTAVQTIALTLGSPLEIEPNNDIAHAQTIPIDGWVAGQIVAPDTADVYKVVIPAAGAYTFETSGALGACAQALELDTILQLLDANAVQLAIDDDTAFPTAAYPGLQCSRISMTLQPGTYFLRVTAFTGSSGTYRLSVRTGA